MTRRQAHEIDPEISEAASVAQLLPHAFGTGCVEGRRIARAFAFWHGGNVDLGHGSVPVSDRAYARSAHSLALPSERTIPTLAMSRGKERRGARKSRRKAPSPGSPVRLTGTAVMLLSSSGP